MPPSLDTKFKIINENFCRCIPDYDIKKRKLHVNFIDNFMKPPTNTHVIHSLVSIEITNSTFVEELNVIISTELKINSNNIFYFSKKSSFQ